MGRSQQLLRAEGVRSARRRLCVTKNAKPDTAYYLPGGGFGGPIVKDRTFFWFATEDYHNVSTRNSSLTLPTAAERTGDFSGADQLRPARRSRSTIRCTHLPFPSNIIPANRINPVAATMLSSTCRCRRPTSTTAAPTTTPWRRSSTTSSRSTRGKIEHKFTDKVSLTGFYLYNRTNEPCSNYFEPGLNGPNRFADPNDYILKRRPQILALNNTWILSDSSVLALRFGWTRFVDNSTMTIDFDPSTLGFSPNVQLARSRRPVCPKFPLGTFTVTPGGYSDASARSTPS